MNCNLDGSPLSVEELFELAVAAGADREKLAAIGAHLHDDGLFGSVLRVRSGEVRHRLWAEGVLRLDTRPLHGPALPPGFEVDWGVVAAFTRAPVPCC